MAFTGRATPGVREVRVEPLRVPSVVVQCPPVPAAVTPTAISPVTARGIVPGVPTAFPAVTTTVGVPQITAVDLNTLAVLSQAAGVPLPQLVATAALLGADPAVLAMSIAWPIPKVAAAPGRAIPPC